MGGRHVGWKTLGSWIGPCGFVCARRQSLRSHGRRLNDGPLGHTQHRRVNDAPQRESGRESLGSGSEWLENHPHRYGNLRPRITYERNRGGTWKKFAPGGTRIAGGKYRVTRLLRWTKGPGTLPVADNIGKKKNASAGLAVLRIRYSDGRKGILVISCHLEGTPDSVFERITVSKGFVHFWRRKAPSDDPFVDAFPR